MWPYPWTHVGTPSHLGHMDRLAATMPSKAHAGAAQEAPDIGQWGGQDVPLVRPSSCFVKGGIPSSRRYLPTWGCPRGGSYQGAFAHTPTAVLHVSPQSGSPTWGKGAVAASSTLQRVLPREVTHVRPESDIPLLWADDTCGRVPLHILINVRILGPRGPEPGQRPCPARYPDLG